MKVTPSPTTLTTLGLISDAGTATSGITFGSAADAAIYRAAAADLRTNSSLTAARSSSTAVAFGALVGAESVHRLILRMDGQMTWGSGSAARDTNLYRSAADTLKTDDKFIAGAGIGVGNAAVAATPGTVTHKIEVFDAAGASLGFLAVYDAIAT